MKKLFLLVATLAISGVAFAEWPQLDFPTTDFPANTEMEASVAKKINTQVMPHDQSVLHIKMDVRARFKGQMQESDNVVTKKCAAVKIDNNWLVASLTCRGTTAIATAYDHHGEPYDKEVEFRSIDTLKVEGVKVSKNDIFVDEASKIILIHLNPSNKKLMAKTNSHVIAPLVMPQNPTALLAAIQTAFINRENYCWPGRCSVELDIKEYCTDKKCYKVEWKLIDGDAGDPLFVQSSQTSKEYLVALNLAEVDGSNVKSGRNYKVFDSNTQNFIQNKISQIDANAWKRISSKLRNEKNL